MNLLEKAVRLDVETATLDEVISTLRIVNIFFSDLVAESDKKQTKALSEVENAINLCIDRLSMTSDNYTEIAEQLHTADRAVRKAAEADADE